MKIKNVYIFGGGTVAHISNHFSVFTPAYGTTAKKLEKLVSDRFSNCNVKLELTKAAGGSLETNSDVKNKIDEIKKDFNTKVVFFNCALVDFEPKSLTLSDGNRVREFGKYNKRLESSPYTDKYKQSISIDFESSDKIIPSIRENRKDIFLIGFKTTCGSTKQQMYEKGLKLCKQSSSNLVLVNDTKTRWNMIVTPEEAAYHETDNREEILKNLVDMAYLRSHLTFTQSTVIDGALISWEDPRIPNSIKTVINYCINGNAYKPFNGATVGHFAIKLSDTEFLTSIRKSNFNDIGKIGMVYVKTDGPDTVLAYGAKPSVGGQSQRIVFKEHQGMDCIVHFHSPLKANHKNDIPVVSQRAVECGSHQCGQQTSSNLKQFGGLKCVMLDQHGPNIIFNKEINPIEVINFINDNFDLNQKTGGYNI